MKNAIYFFLVLILLFLPKNTALANEPDSAYVFAYASEHRGNNTGLYYAWSIDKKKWHPIEPEFRFIRSDYGPWGAQKKMFSPVLVKGGDGYWHAVWEVNSMDPTFAHAKSSDLILWYPQSFPIIEHGDNCLAPEIRYNSGEDRYIITWYGNKSGENKFYTVSTRDFRNYTPAKEIVGFKGQNLRDTVLVINNKEVGTIHKVEWNQINNLIQKSQVATYRKQLYSENMSGDSARFSDLKPLEATLAIHADDTKAISNKLIGLFFEDINYAADGGIYAELIQNRGFEYSYNRGKWNACSFWKLVGENALFRVAAESPLHENTPHYAVLTTTKVGASLQNEGFGGIVLKAGDKYDFSLFARTLDGKNGKLKIRLVDESGAIYGEALTRVLSKDWQQYTATITALRATADARLEIIPQTEGNVALDMISLFPQKTFKGRKNGLRADIAQALADIKPQFVRFPGGCVVHGNGIENMYNWKHTVGPLETRKTQPNIWGYHQSMGLGYYEYFQFCEDIGAHPLPVVPAGVPCQNSEKQNHPVAGQQGGVPMNEMDGLVQDVLDLIEWANGDPKTNIWAKMRADAGHPKPFGLKYLGVGNEDLMSDVFEERFSMIYKAVKEKYPDIIVIGTIGAGDSEELHDYTRGWEFATELGIPIVDEHSYKAPGWVIHNQDYYDRYDRNKSKVYVGEYAVHVSGRVNNVEAALTEAMYLCNVERNGDIVEMVSYAPLLAKEGFTQWTPDLIFFNNSEMKLTVSYEVQKLFGNNSGNEYISSTLNIDNKDTDIQKRIVQSVVRDSKTGDTIIKLVNLLPVEVSLRFQDWNSQNQKIEKSVLQGSPDDTVAMVVTEEVELLGNEVILPRYSLVILRIKNN